jgi:hypothetical protein
MKNNSLAFPELVRLRNDSGPSTIIYDAETIGGMTMRQYYKAAALNLIRAGYLSYAKTETPKDEDHGCQLIAEAAAQIADAMLAEDEEHAKKG